MRYNINILLGWLRITESLGRLKEMRVQLVQLNKSNGNETSMHMSDFLSSAIGNW